MVGDDTFLKVLLSKWHHEAKIQSALVPSTRHVLVCSPPILSFCHTYLFVFVHAEILDFGYPQNSETGALKTFITQQGIKGQVSGAGYVLNIWKFIVVRQERN